MTSCVPGQVKHWHLKQYSRFQPNESIKIPGSEVGPGSNGTWKTDESSATSAIWLTLTSDGHMLITRDTKVFENIFLPFAKSHSKSSKIFKKKETLAFLYNVSQESRMFRAQFSETDNQTAEDACRECVESLSLYFTVRQAAPDNADNKKEEKNEDKGTQDTDGTPEDLEEANISVLTSKILKNSVSDLPLIYRECKFSEDSLSPDAAEEQQRLEQFMYMCIADPSFPAFVDKVEIALKKLTSVDDDE